MNDSQRYSALSYRSDLEDAIDRFRTLARDLEFEDDAEEVITVVVDSLKYEEFADPDDYDHWETLRETIRDRFDFWITQGVDWRPLARLMVKENRLLYQNTGEFYRVMRLGTRILPGEVAVFMEETAATHTRNE